MGATLAAAQAIFSEAFQNSSPVLHAKRARAALWVGSGGAGRAWGGGAHAAAALSRCCRQATGCDDDGGRRRALGARRRAGHGPMAHGRLWRSARQSFQKAWGLRPAGCGAGGERRGALLLLSSRVAPIMAA